MTYPSPMEYHGFLSGLLANIPAAALAGRLYWATDVYMLFRDTGAAWEIVGPSAYARILVPLHGNPHAGNSGVTIGRVYLRPLEVQFTVTVNSADIWVQAQAGNVILGIYRDNGDTPAGGAVVAETPSTVVGVATRAQEIAYSASARLTPGLYWVAFEASNSVTARFGRLEDDILLESNATLRTWYYDRAGGYGALTDPCPVVTVHDYLTWMQHINVLSIP